MEKTGLKSTRNPNRIRNSYKAQRYRCNNPNSQDYKYYGAKGIKVEYNFKEFSRWYLEKEKAYPINTRLVVDRLDHSKNYCFSNIRLVTQSENAKESNRRRSYKIIDVYSYPDRDYMFTAKNYADLSKILNEKYGKKVGLSTLGMSTTKISIKHGISWNERK